MKNQQWVTEQLHDGIVCLCFEKADGTLRAMKATLDPRLIPSMPVSESTRRRNSNVCSVWDLDQAAWRSFRWDRLLEANGFTVEVDSVQG